MNLYKISIEVCGQKFQKESLLYFLTAGNDEQVYNYLDKHELYGGWSESEADQEDIEGEEKFKDRVLREQGDIGSEYNDYSDGYYGNYFYAWKLVKEDVTDKDITILKLAECLK